jgi:hypothetical protein
MQRLKDFGLTSKEIQAVVEMATQRELTALQVLRKAIRLYQADCYGSVECEWQDDLRGCPVVE